MNVLCRILGALLGLGVLGGASAQPSPEVVEGYYPGDETLWNRAFEGRGPGFVQPEGQIVAAVAPHHDIEVFSLGDYYRTLAARVDPPVIVLLSPNHFEVGTTPVVLAPAVVYPTVDGTLATDGPFGADLARDLGRRASVLAGVWGAEHGVFMHVPYLRHFFPRARFVPVLLRMDAGADTDEALAQALDSRLPPGSLVLASVDFSHYQIDAVARFHDLATATALGRGDSASVLTKEVDSPQALDTAWRFASLRGARRWVPVARTTAASYSRDPLSETTSHLYWTVVEGESVTGPRVTLVAGGTSDLGLGLRTSWPWDRYHRNPDPETKRLRGLAGKEARFLGGFDLYLLAPTTGWSTLQAGGVEVQVYGWDETRPFGAQVAAVAARAAEGWVAVTRSPTRVWNEDEVTGVLATGAKLVLERRSGPPGTPQVRGPTLWVPGLGALTTEGADAEGRILLASWAPEGWIFDTLPVVVRQGLPQPIYQFGDITSGEGEVEVPQDTRP